MKFQSFTRWICSYVAAEKVLCFKHDLFFTTLVLWEQVYCQRIANQNCITCIWQYAYQLDFVEVLCYVEMVDKRAKSPISCCGGWVSGGLEVGWLAGVFMVILPSRLIRCAKLTQHWQTRVQCHHQFYKR